ncbi:DNA internalization-related competence protein ComEC/Rec2 [uncultured Robinsoniella sp.]|uniref:DNA internalization-related competence protein ComEC/Rec2 n=1 Tax=uncultured Robinsoniella sp. TaxID=904190 RepID=UPI00374E6FEA
MTKRPLCVICLLVIGWLLVSGKYGVNKDSSWTSRFYDKKVTVTGRLVKQEQSATSNQLYLKDNSISFQSISYKIPKQKQILIFTDNISRYKAGSLLKVSGTCQETQEPGNPGQFDLKKYYEIKGIQMVLNKGKVISAGRNYWHIRQFLWDVRERFKQTFLEIADEENASVLDAMLLGDKKDLDPEVKKLYQDNGIAHILAISGLHISMLGMALHKLLRKLGISWYLSAAAAGIIMSAYGLMTGFGVSTTRAVVMFLVYLLAGILGRTYDILSALALAALLILLENPRYLTDAGFLLSFSAVLGVAVLAPVIRGIFTSKNKLLESFLVSLAIQLTTIPIVLYFYFEIPLYGVVLNLAVIPLMSLVLGFGIAGGMAGLISIPAGIFLVSPCYYILGLYKFLCAGVLNLPLAKIIVGKPDLWQIVVYYLLLLSACLIKQKKQSGEIFKWIWGTTLMMFVISRQPAGGMRITFLDVGQGDGICIQAPGGINFMIDGGSSDVKQVGSKRIEPFLKSRGIQKLDYLFISHMDADHINGIMELLQAYALNLAGENAAGVSIRYLVLPKLAKKDEEYLEIEKIAKKNKIMVLYFQKGDKILNGRFSFSCLHPSKNSAADDRNENSMVLQMAYKNFHVFFAGDVEGQGEEEMMNSKELKKADILKVAHHGSKNSTPESFLDVINPQIGILSCGKDNRYGHPHEELVSRLKKAGVAYYSTTEYGALEVSSDGEGMDIRGMKNPRNSNK